MQVLISTFSPSHPALSFPRTVFPLPPPHLTVASHELPQPPPRASRTLTKSRSQLLESRQEVIPRGIPNPCPDHLVLPRNQIARSRSSSVDRYRVPKITPVGRAQTAAPSAPCSLFTIYCFWSIPHGGVRAPLTTESLRPSPRFAIPTFFGS